MSAMVRAVILAAGASSRMGRPKAGLAVNGAGETFLSQIVRRMHAAGVPDIVVVTGAAADAVRRAALTAAVPVRFEHNEEWSAGQLTSLIAGLRPRPGDIVEGALVTLVDTPFVTTETIRRIIAAWRSRRAAIVRPARGALHGHPVMFDCRVFPALRAADPRVGAKAVVRAWAEAIDNLPVEDPGAFRDVDTPADYQEAQREFGPGPSHG